MRTSRPCPACFNLPLSPHNLPPCCIGQCWLHCTTHSGHARNLRPGRVWPTETFQACKAQHCPLYCSKPSGCRCCRNLHEAIAFSQKPTHRTEAHMTAGLQSTYTASLRPQVLPTCTQCQPSSSALCAHRCQQFPVTTQETHVFN